MTLAGSKVITTGNGVVIFGNTSDITLRKAAAAHHVCKHLVRCPDASGFPLADPPVKGRPHHRTGGRTTSTTRPAHGASAEMYEEEISCQHDH